MNKSLQNTLKHPMQMLIALCILFANIAYAQQKPADAVEQKLLEIYKQIKNPEIPFQRFLEINRHVYEKNLSVKTNILGISSLTIGTSCSKIRNFCDNGDFESGLDTSQWLGAYGTSTATDPDPALLTDGFLAGPINSASARQTIVTTGTDPITGISLPAPNGGSQALRLGNAINGLGVELLGKTITVGADRTVFDFSYAVVFEDPNHDPEDQPSLTVRVFDCATGAEITGVCDLGNGSNKIISDAQNPFFQSANGGTIAYRDWSRAQINLSAYIGKTVTIYFVNKDCALSGHFGYTYLDNFCSTGPNCDPSSDFCTGELGLNISKVDTCGPGQICVNYTLPRVPGQTGSITIDLDIFQNGVKVNTLTSPTLTQDTSYCFSIDPATLGVADSLGGFDYVVTGRFLIGTRILPSVIAGNNGPPNGQVPGANNDYGLNCNGVITQCCPGTNLITNPGFGQGNTDFTSNYIYQPTIAPASVLPGYYTVATPAQALTISPTWDVSCAPNGNALFVNGATGKPGDRKLIWRQEVKLDYGKKYKFCANLKNLPQIGFDVKPNVVIRFVYRNSGVAIVDNISKVIDVPAGSCWELVEKEINLLAVGRGSTNLTISILLDESGYGDGNDLAIDNISLTELAPVPVSQLLFDVSFINVARNTFNISADPIAPLDSKCTSNWQVAEVNANYNVIPGTQVVNPSEWSLADPNLFNGYVGSSVLGDTMQAGEFRLNKRYRISYSRSCDCAVTNSFAAIIDPVGSGGNTQKIRFIAEGSQFSGVNDKASAVNGANLSGAENNAVKESDVLPKAFEIYPNPAKNNLTVNFAKAGEKSRLVIYNTNGGIVKEVPVSSGKNRIDVNTSALPSGTYFIKLFTNNKVDGSKVFLKQ